MLIIFEETGLREAFFTKAFDIFLAKMTISLKINSSLTNGSFVLNSDGP